MRSSLRSAPATAVRRQPLAPVAMAVLVAISLVAWVWMFRLMDGPSMAHMMALEDPWRRAWGDMAMWIAMIIATMLPIATAQIVGCCFNENGAFVPLEGASFTAGYATSCLALAVVATSVAGWLHPSATGVISPLGILSIGAYQLTPLKLGALAANQGDLFRSRVRASGSVPKDYDRGVRHAFGCFGSCGASMVAPMFGGMMTSAAMVGLFVWMCLEQAGAISNLLAEIIGTVWIVAGLFLLWQSVRGTII